MNRISLLPTPTWPNECCRYVGCDLFSKDILFSKLKSDIFHLANDLNMVVISSMIFSMLNVNLFYYTKGSENELEVGGA